jgi:hypothetical protein
VWAALNLASGGWRGVSVTPRTLTDPGRDRQLLHVPIVEEVNTESVIAAASRRAGALRPSR